MDEREAQQLCAKLAAEHPDRETHRWIARADDAGEWSVVKIGLPPIGEQKITADRNRDPVPPVGPDLQQSINRGVGGFG